MQHKDDQMGRRVQGEGMPGEARGRGRNSSGWAVMGEKQEHSELRLGINRFPVSWRWDTQPAVEGFVEFGYAGGCWLWLLFLDLHMWAIATTYSC